MIEISVVVPVFNEEENLVPLFTAIEKVMQTLSVSWELILIDDGSTDNSWKNIVELSKLHTEVRGISFSRNFGHNNAMHAGMTHSKGKSVITMDADLQHPPELIKELFQKWQDGYKIVQTKRIDSEDFSFIKRLFSKLFNKIFSLLSGIPMESGISDFRLLDRVVVAEILKMNDHELFFRGIIQWIGFDNVQIEFKAHNRLHGETKWSFRKLVRYSSNALVSFSIIPLKLGIWVGLFTSFLAFIEILYIFVRYFQGETIPGWASTLTIISFMFGILFILLGIIGSYLGRIYETLKNRPKYIIGSQTESDS